MLQSVLTEFAESQRKFCYCRQILQEHIVEQDGLPDYFIITLVKLLKFMLFLLWGSMPLILKSKINGCLAIFLKLKYLNTIGGKDTICTSHIAAACFGIENNSGSLITSEVTNTFLNLRQYFIY